MIRRVTEADVPWVLGVASQTYSTFDIGIAEAWLRQAISEPTMLCIRGGRGFCIASVGQKFYSPEIEADVLFLAALPGAGWEGYRLLKSVIGWAREIGAHSLHIGEDTGVDLGVLAKRLGGKPERPSYRVGLQDGET